MKILKRILVLGTILCTMIGIKGVKAASYDTKVSIDWMSGVYANRRVDGLNYYNQVGFIYANGILSYCLESTKFITEDVYHSTIDFSSKLTPQQKEYIELLAYYGYGYQNHTAKEYYMATQELIWEYLEGVEVYFTTKSQGQGSVYHIEEYKQEIKRLVQSHHIFPSFKDQTLTYGEGSYLNISDLNGVIDRYEVVSGDPNLKLDSKGFSFHTTGFGKFHFELQLKTRNEVSFLYYMGDSQTIGSFGLSNRQKFSFDILLTPGPHPLQLQKVDSFTKEPIKQEGIGFKIKNIDTNEYLENGKVYMTDSDGKIITKHIPVGHYLIEEVKTVEGYYGIPNMEITIDENTLLVNQNFYFEYGNEPWRSRIKIYKVGDVLVDMEEGNPIYEEKGLDHIEFDVIAKEDIKDGHYTYYHQNEVVDHLTTNLFGQAMSKELPYGTYCIKETKSKDPYETDETCHEVILKEPTTTEIEVETLKLVNHRTETKLYLKKVGEKFVYQENHYLYQPLKDIVFELYAKEDIVEDGQVILKKDEYIDSYTTDESGEIMILNLPYGSYYLKEQVPEDYVDKEEVWEFTFDSDHIYHTFSIKNELKKGSIIIHKTDQDNGQNLENVKFGLYTENGQLIYTGYTNYAGELKFEDLPYGTYQMKELESLSNYQKNDQVWTVKVDEQTPEVTLDITNEKIDYPNTTTTYHQDVTRSLLQSILVLGICVGLLKRYVS